MKIVINYFVKSFKNYKFTEGKVKVDYKLTHIVLFPMTCCMNRNNL